MALVAPVLILLLLGIVDFGWAFSENLDVRHGAREASRLVAVNYRPNANAEPPRPTTSSPRSAGGSTVGRARR